MLQLADVWRSVATKLLSFSVVLPQLPHAVLEELFGADLPKSCSSWLVSVP